MAPDKPPVIAPQPAEELRQAEAIRLLVAIEKAVRNPMWGEERTVEEIRKLLAAPQGVGKLSLMQGELGDLIDQINQRLQVVVSNCEGTPAEDAGLDVANLLRKVYALVTPKEGVEGVGPSAREWLHENAYEDVDVPRGCGGPCECVTKEKLSQVLQAHSVAQREEIKDLFYALSGLVSCIAIPASGEMHDARFTREPIEIEQYFCRAMAALTRHQGTAELRSQLREAKP